MIVNRKIRFNYNIISTWEAGIELLGTEVKAIRLGMGGISNAYGMIDNGEVFLMNMNIPKYKYSVYNHDEFRRRRLLLKRKEINKMIKSQEKHHTLVPAKVYINARGYVKVTIALCSGKQKFDKRRAIKEREMRREAQ